jgi:NAD(P)-dependent dehydrogenase (short-subunit alcohol dehydrogenase family)
MLLEGKTAVITGAGAGFGRASAGLFGEHGAQLVVSDIDPDRVSLAVDHLRESGVDVIGKVADVSVEGDVAALVEAAVERFGSLDIMYNNAGFENPAQWGVPFEDSTDDMWQTIIGVNLSGVYYGIKHAARAMKLTGGGSIVNTTSAAALRGVPGHTLYAGAKSGADGLIRNAAVDLGAYGIRVNGVAPASFVPNNYVLPPGTAVLDEARAWELIQGYPTDHIPLNRFGRRRELAQVALFLASDLSSFVTGVTIPVDGGVTRVIKSTPPPGSVIERFKALQDRA